MRGVTVWEPVNQAGNVSQRIVAQIEDLLAKDALKPGDRLPTERDMAELLGTSRPSVREAVRILQAQGRLIVRHGRGVFVAESQTKQALGAALSNPEVNVNELFAMREVLEVPAAQWAAEQITDEQIVDLREILDELDSAFDDSGDFQRLARLDATFHLAIAQAAGNRFLRQTTDVLHDILIEGMQTTLLIPGRREKARKQHESIVAALENRDPSEAGQAARRHIRSAHHAALERIAAEKGEQ
ncbi:FadR family transcriptional regulator [Actinobacteria bacterium YIM 96077]|uniref:FadR family transcriptional regulator n=1 Tax=Phytoactinopolyspora halophila TaxID=1981511 RepID=A0A329QYT9_9ACTN|nr:FadR/GntR family transcriptional regulator [Phytoactinopolyspora halophila]AYY13177.1 FadR family transcriptional regulator [Actinobacteria bacterium YIM 96077]RAW17584.1 FadR family transcriptional regulator [Phytoactinopolyspora halophila]